MNETNPVYRVIELEYLLRNECCEIDPKKITDTSFYSYRHINRLFTSKNGESIKSFINRIKLQKSAEYLFYSSKSIFEIAIEVGYESTSSFSKMFKKTYGVSPSEYRKANKKNSLLKNNDIKYNSERFLTQNVRVKKLTFRTGISFDEFYQLIKTTYQATNKNNENFMILWDEDPQMIQSKTSRCFIAFENSNSEQLTDKIPILRGKYIRFDTSSFKMFDYSEWHKVAFSLLELENIEMRESTYIEHFTFKSLESINSFYPQFISTAIE